MYIFFVEVSFKVFGPFFIQMVSYYSVLRVLGIFCVTVLYHLCLSQILSPTLWLIFFYSWYYLLQRRNFFKFYEVQFIISFMNCVIGVRSKKSSPLQGILGFLLFYFLGVSDICILQGL